MSRKEYKYCIDWKEFTRSWADSLRDAMVDGSKYIGMYNIHTNAITKISKQSTAQKQFNSIDEIIKYIEKDKRKQSTPKQLWLITKLLNKCVKKEEISQSKLLSLSTSISSLNLGTELPNNIFSKLPNGTIKKIYELISDMIGKGDIKEDRMININNIFADLMDKFDIVLTTTLKSKIKQIWSEHKSLGKISNYKYKITNTWYIYLKNLKNQGTKKFDVLHKQYQLNKQLIANKSPSELNKIKKNCEEKEKRYKSWDWNMFGQFPYELQNDCLRNWEIEFSKNYHCNINNRFNFNRNILDLHESEDDTEQKEHSPIVSRKNKKRKRQSCSDDDMSFEPQTKKRRLNNNNNNNNEYHDEYDEYLHEYDEYDDEDDDDDDDDLLSCPKCSEAIELQSCLCQKCKLTWIVY